MKKTLILAAAFVFATSLMSFADTDKTVTTTQKAGKTIDRPAPPNFNKPPKGPDFQKRKAEFEKRLNLTDEQKAKAEQIHKQGFEKMKPIMEKIKQKHQELKALQAEQNEANKEKIEQLRKELGALKKEAHEIRQQNMKDFDALLTKKQKKELDKIKEEGRKKFEQEHKKPHPNFKPGYRPGGPIELMPQPPVQKEVK